ncbi:hypothetical protein V6N13_129499 [Hibiscus sabdariffa]
MLVCLLGRVVLPSKNIVGLSPGELVRLGCVRWWRRRRGRRKGGGASVKLRYVLGTGSELGYSQFQIIMNHSMKWFAPMFRVRLKVRARARFKNYATKIFVDGDQVGANGGVDVLKYWNVATACSEAMELSVIASKGSMFARCRGEGRKVRAFLSFHFENCTFWNSLQARSSKDIVFAGWFSEFLGILSPKIMDLATIFKFYPIYKEQWAAGSVGPTCLITLGVIFKWLRKGDLHGFDWICKSFFGTVGPTDKEKVDLGWSVRKGYTTFWFRLSEEEFVMVSVDWPLFDLCVASYFPNVFIFEVPP